MSDDFGKFVSEMEEMENRIKFIGSAVGADPFAHPTPEMEGDFIIGYGDSGQAVGVKDNGNPKNMIFLGFPGKGKTCLALNLAKQMWDRKTIIFHETSKKNTSNKLFGIRNNVLQLDYESGSIKLNLLETPHVGVSQRMWDQIFISNLCQSGHFVQGSGTNRFAFTALQILREKVGNKKINLFDYRDFVKSMKINRFSQNYRYWENLCNRLDDICELLKNSINYSEGYSIKALLESGYKLVAKYPERPDIFNLCSTDLIFRELKYQESMLPEERNSIVNFVDEAHHIAGPQTEYMRYVGGLSNFIWYLANGREANISFIMISQAKSLIHPAAFSYFHICGLFQCDGDTLQRMGVHIMGMNYDQKNWILEQGYGLEQRRLILKNDIFPCVLLTVPEINIRYVSDEEISEKCKDYYKEFSYKERDPWVKKIILEEVESRGNKTNELLKEIAMNPERSKMEHQNSLKWTNNQMNKAAKELVSQLLVRETRVYSGRRGGQPVFLELTQKGREEAERRGIKPAKIIRGSLKHHILCKKIAENFKNRGYQTKMEFWVEGPDLFIDSIAQKENEDIAIEIEISDPNHAAVRIKRLLDSNIFTDILLLSDSGKIINKTKSIIKREFPEYEKQGVRIQTIQDYFRDKNKD